MAVAIVSKRSAMVITKSGFRLSKAVVISIIPNPTLFAIVTGFSPSTII